MIIVSGHLLVDAERRDDHLAALTDEVERAREAPGCLDYALSADLVDPRRVNVLERWISAEHRDDFRGDGPGEESEAEVRETDVHEFTVAGPEEPSLDEDAAFS